jgi:hypothetical protein
VVAVAAVVAVQVTVVVASLVDRLHNVLVLSRAVA